jgi:hypothetical protein
MLPGSGRDLLVGTVDNFEKSSYARLTEKERVWASIRLDRCNPSEISFRHVKFCPAGEEVLASD